MSTHVMEASPLLLHAEINIVTTATQNETHQNSCSAMPSSRIYDIQRLQCSEGLNHDTKGRDGKYYTLPMRPGGDTKASTRLSYVRSKHKKPARPKGEGDCRGSCVSRGERQGRRKVVGLRQLCGGSRRSCGFPQNSNRYPGLPYPSGRLA